ncbi:MAG: N-acetylglutaminylglutamine amidotransferase [Desulfotignum sp.]|nr:N-acetylglutaminylglutamine amidotransferase [Desulfotignum sp.]
MCGICGEIFFNRQPIYEDSVIRMNQAMTIRGPDNEDIYHGIWTLMGHRRLKIIDLSDDSNQPMIDPKLGLIIVYNGAIYNYKTLRDELVEKGYTFHTGGDTEVILKAYDAWGENCVQHFNGMFAFAIYNQTEDKVFLARDRLGIKPLYFHKTDSSLLFASSLPALMATGKIKPHLSVEALHYYLTFHSVVPAPHTLISGIEKLPSATWAVISQDGTMTRQTYWQPTCQRDKEEDTYAFEDWKLQVSQTLMASVKRRLTADVPVGVLLSGGLDSSLVVGLLAEAGQKDLKTFSIGFDSVGDEKGDEFLYSDIIARHFATDHHKIQVDGNQVLPSMPDCVKAMSEPMVSHDCIGFYLLSRKVAEHVKVVQSGQGADELFGGYHWYPPMMESADPVMDYRSVFGDRSHEEYLEMVTRAFHGPDYSTQFIQQHFDMPGADTPIDKTLRLDTLVMLTEDPVKRVDNMTMAASLEARVPFLDHTLVELVAKIPAEHKVGHGGKHILKEAARAIIPNEVIDRPKGYFPVPALKYLQGEYLDFVTGILNTDAARDRNLFNRDYIDRLLADPDSHITPLKGSKLWQAALLEYWCQQHDI